MDTRGAWLHLCLLGVFYFYFDLRDNGQKLKRKKKEEKNWIVTLDQQS